MTHFTGIIRAFGIGTANYFFVLYSLRRKGKSDVPLSDFEVCTICIFINISLLE